MSNKKLVTILCLVFFAANALIAQNKYVGAKSCKMCHNNPAKGEQYNKWSSTLHSKAFATLSSDAAMTYAKANGIADPSKEAKCLKCHSTAAAADASLLTATITKEEGVSCESCHGAGSAYKTMSIMKDKATAITNGLNIPDQKTCEKCHTAEGNPFFKPFDYATMVAKISHKDPSK
jgi:hypothetical protein